MDQDNLFMIMSRNNAIKGEITYKEFTKEYNELIGQNDNTNGNQKKKWVHPLNREKYRDRFILPDR